MSNLSSVNVFLVFRAQKYVGIKMLSSELFLLIVHRSGSLEQYILGSVTVWWHARCRVTESLLYCNIWLFLDYKKGGGRHSLWRRQIPCHSRCVVPLYLIAYVYFWSADVRCLSVCSSVCNFFPDFIFFPEPQTIFQPKLTKKQNIKNKTSNQEKNEGICLSSKGNDSKIVLKIDTC